MSGSNSQNPGKDSAAKDRSPAVTTMSGSGKVKTSTASGSGLTRMDTLRVPSRADTKHEREGSPKLFPAEILRGASSSEREASKQDWIPDIEDLYIGIPQGSATASRRTEKEPSKRVTGKSSVTSTRAESSRRH